MLKRSGTLCCILALFLGAAVYGFQFNDKFDVTKDYMVDGTEGTVWDGMMGLDAGQTANAINASINRPGALYLESANAVWDAPWSPLGPFLYKNVTGDFVMTVKVTDFAGTKDAPLFHNDGGILAKDPNGAAVNFVSMCYFPTWTGFVARNTTNGTREELGQPAGRWTGADTYAMAAQYPYLQLERKGSNFTFRISADGVKFLPLTKEGYKGIYDGTQTPLVVSRPDLPATLQVGLFQCTYTADAGYIAFDDVALKTEQIGDGFDGAKDYMVDGTEGTIWDGFLGLDAGQTANAINASVNRPGALYLESANAVYDAPWSPLGPLLYKNVTGDFVVTVKVTDFAGTKDAPLFHNDGGILARDPNGAVVNFVSMCYFPTWTGFVARNTTNGTREELGQPAGRWTGADTYAMAAQYPYLQLERKGSNFYFRISSDGKNFLPLTKEAYKGIYDGTQTPLVVSRPDLPATLQVGLFQCTYTADAGYIAFDDFSVKTAPVADAFTAVKDYMVDGTDATIWDGMIGLDAGQTANAINASVNRPGALYLESANAVWDAPWSPLGPFLYREVCGDFVATVKVTDFAGTAAAPLFHNDGGILAKDPNGAAVNFVSMCYFPTWTGFVARNTTNGTREELGQPAGRWTGADTYAMAAQYPYLQLERKGSDFTFRISADGVNFLPLTKEGYKGIYDGTQTPLVVSRPDLPATLQVGLFQCTYTADAGYIGFDDFSITRY